MSKPTAVEWLVEKLILDELIDVKNGHEFLHLQSKAKKMEKEQIIDIIKLVIEKEYHEQTWSKCGSISYVAEQYYNETFKTE